MKTKGRTAVTRAKYHPLSLRVITPIINPPIPATIPPERIEAKIGIRGISDRNPSNVPWNLDGTCSKAVVYAPMPTKTV